MSGIKGKSGRKKDPPAPQKLIKEIIPIEEIFDEQEVALYHDLVDVYMADFDRDDLSSSDVDDIMDLAKNRILEFRLLKTTKDNADRHLDISAALEKLKKENKTLKENLFARRKDRINPNEFKGFSIVDLAVAFDEEKKRKLQNHIFKSKEEEEEILGTRVDYVGNRYDADSDKFDEDEEGI